MEASSIISHTILLQMWTLQSHRCVGTPTAMAAVPFFGAEAALPANGVACARLTGHKGSVSASACRKGLA